MTPKQIAHDIIEQENVYLAQAYQLAQAYLDLESRLEKVQAVVKAAIRLAQPSDWTNFDKRVALVKAVDALEPE